MKKTLPFLFVILLIGLIVSCDKDPQPNTDQITIGDYEGMDVFTYDSIEWELVDYLEAVAYYGGINVDGKTVGLSTTVLSNPYNGNPLDCYEIGIYSDDLAFHYHTVHNDIFYHVDSTVIQTDSVTLIYLDGITSCYQISESDQLEESYNINILFQHEKNENLNKGDSFKNSSSWGSFYIPLYLSNAECLIQMALDSINAIVYESYTYAASECKNFPLNEPFFLGFKCTYEFGDRLGWIKLIIEPNADGYYIPKPLEAAIQKQQTIWIFKS